MKKIKNLTLCVVALSSVAVAVTPAINPWLGNAVSVQAESKAQTALAAILVKDATALRGAFTDKDAAFLTAEKTSEATVENLKTLFKDGTSTNITTALADQLVSGSSEEFKYVDDSGNVIKEKVGNTDKTTDKTGTYKKGGSSVTLAKEYLKSKYEITNISVTLDSGFAGKNTKAALNSLKNTTFTFGIKVTTLKNADNFTVASSFVVKEPTVALADATATVGDTYSNGLTLTDYNGDKLAIKAEQTVEKGTYDGYAYVYRDAETNKVTKNAVGYASYEKMTIPTDGKYDKAGNFTEKITFVRFDNAGAATADMTYTASRKVTVKEKEKEKEPEVVKPTVTKVKLYRAYNPNSGEHLYTTDQLEQKMLVDLGWKNEGTAWDAPSTGSPVYRLYNPNSGEHFYTASLAEYDATAAAGWAKEGIAFRSSDTSGTPVYRMFNPSTKGAGSHHYTTSEAERDALMTLGWKSEHIVFYGMK